MNYAEQENWFPVRGGYCSLPLEWFDETVMYWREGWEAPQAFRLRDQGGAFNIADLYYFGGLTRLKMAAYEQFEAQDYRADEACNAALTGWVLVGQDRIAGAARNADVANRVGRCLRGWPCSEHLIGSPFSM